MSNTIDLLIQDFVTTNKLVNQNVSWDTLVSRRFENGRRRMFTYSGTAVATAEHLDDADGEWLQITLTTEKIEDGELRFDCLKLMHANTHYAMSVEKDKDLLIKLLTRNKGLMNVVFKICASAV
jgi:hypothetical protein